MLSTIKMLCIIYELQCLETGDNYVGHTTVSMSVRKSGHIGGRSKTCRKARFIRNHPDATYEMKHLQTQQDLDLSQRRQLEQKWIDRIKPTLNENRAYISKEDLRVKDNNRRIAKREVIVCDCGLQITNLEMCRHKRSKLHRRWESGTQRERTGRGVWVICECGLQFSKRHLARHKKTTRHMRRLAAKKIMLRHRKYEYPADEHHSG